MHTAAPGLALYIPKKRLSYHKKKIIITASPCRDPIDAGGAIPLFLVELSSSSRVVVGCRYRVVPCLRCPYVTVCLVCLDWCISSLLSLLKPPDRTSYCPVECSLPYLRVVGSSLIDLLRYVVRIFTFLRDKMLCSNGVPRRVPCLS